MSDFAAGFFAPWLLYAALLALHLWLPALEIEGYVAGPGGKGKLVYRLNGPLVMLGAVVLWALSGSLGLLPWNWLYLHRWSGLAGSCVAGLVLSIAAVAATPTGAATAAGAAAATAVTAPRRGQVRRLLDELYRGRAENPQYLGARIDGKMFLYLAGATMLGLNLLSFLAQHVMSFSFSASPGLILYCGLFFWFIVDYLVFERVHLYTYDLFAERLGFKLVWGCLVFYPYFYAIGLWAAVDLSDPQVPAWVLVASGCVFFLGWILSRGANLQKYLFKTSPERALLGVLKPESISDGKQSLLCSGFWGLARHLNYLGEILMALGLTLSLGRPGLWPIWLYPLYYLALLLPRERADERRCAAKYGELWKEYVRRVPRRIVPGLY